MSAGEVLAFDPKRRTNARAIADLARIGWLRPTDRVLDLTGGRAAAFWKLWRPGEGELVTNGTPDPAVAADAGTSTAGAPPLASGSFDVTLWDPAVRLSRAPRGWRRTSVTGSPTATRPPSASTPI